MALAGYLYEQDSYVPLARMDQTKGTTEPQLYYFHCNASGQSEELTDANGNILWHARYATWGKLVFESTTSHAPFGFEQNLRMQGQYDDRITGLYYNTFRYYDPDIGRFTTEDPIGLLGGTNLYQYAPNPLSWIDPWGWDPLPDNALVCRGGSCTVDSFIKGSGVTLDSNGNLNGVSVNSAPEKGLAELSKGIPHNKIGVTTVGEIRAAGGNVVASPTRQNPNHATLSGISPGKASELMNPTQKNPSKPAGGNGGCA